VYGEDVEAFRPERWMESEEKKADMSRYLTVFWLRLLTSYIDRFFFAFGSGARTCIGRSESRAIHMLA